MGGALRRTVTQHRRRREVPHSMWTTGVFCGGGEKAADRGRDEYAAVLGSLQPDWSGPDELWSARAEFAGTQRIT